MARTLKETERKVRDLSSQAGNPKDGSEMQTFQAGQNEILGIQQQQQQLLREQMLQQQARGRENAVLAQAGELGVMTAATSGPSQQLAGQVSRMQPQTQETLAKYGVRPGQPQTQTQRKTTQQVTPQKVQITNNNITTTKNDIKITQPTIPMKQVAVGAGAGIGAAAMIGKFKTWMSNVFAKQREEDQVRAKEYQRKEWSLNHSASRMMRGLEKLGKTFADRLDPRKLTKGGMTTSKLISTLITISTIATFWPKLLSWIDKAANFFGFGDLGWQGSGLRKGLMTILGADDNKTLPQAIKEYFWDSGENTGKLGIVNYFIEKFKEAIGWEDRIKALKEIKLPDFGNSTDNKWGGLLNGITSALGSIGEYIRDILTALLTGKSFSSLRAGRQVQTESLNNMTVSNSEIISTDRPSNSQNQNAKNYNSTIAGYITNSNGDIIVSKNSWGAGDYAVYGYEGDKRQDWLMPSDQKDGKITNGAGASMRLSSTMTNKVGSSKISDINNVVSGFHALKEQANESGKSVHVVPELLDKLTNVYGLDLSDLKKKTEKVKFVPVPRPGTDFYQAHYPGQDEFFTDAAQFLKNREKYWWIDLLTLGVAPTAEFIARSINRAGQAVDAVVIEKIKNGDLSDFVLQAVPIDSPIPGIVDKNKQLVTREVPSLDSNDLGRIEREIAQKVGLGEGEDTSFDNSNTNFTSKHQSYLINSGKDQSLNNALLEEQKKSNIAAIPSPVSSDSRFTRFSNGWDETSIKTYLNSNDVVKKTFLQGSEYDPNTGKWSSNKFGKNQKEYVDNLYNKFIDQLSKDDTNTKLDIGNGTVLDLSNFVDSRSRDEIERDVKRKYQEESLGNLSEAEKTLQKQIDKDKRRQETGEEEGVSFSQTHAYQGARDGYEEYVEPVVDKLFGKISNNKVSGKYVVSGSLDNANTIREALKNDLGINDTAISGVLGNLYRESGLNPKATNQTSNAQGIAQWLGDRKTKLESYYKTQTGIDSEVKDIPLQYQIDYMIQEAKNRKELMSELKKIPNDHSNDSIVQAADIWLRGFEFGSDNKLVTKHRLQREISNQGGYNAFQEKNAGFALDIDQKSSSSSGYISNVDKDNITYAGFVPNNNLDIVNWIKSNVQGKHNTYADGKNGTSAGGFKVTGNNDIQTDCSSMAREAFKQITGYDIGSNTGSQIKKGVWVDEGGVKQDSTIFNSKALPNESALQPGDLLFYRKNGNLDSIHRDRDYGVGHVEVYIGNGKKIGTGGTKDVNPTPVDTLPGDQTYIGAKRYVDNKGNVAQNLSASYSGSGNNSINVQSGNFDGTSSTSSSGGGIFSGLKGIFGSVGEAFSDIFNGIMESFENLAELNKPEYNWKTLPDDEAKRIIKQAENKRGGRQFTEEEIKSTTFAEQLTALDPEHEYIRVWSSTKPGEFFLQQRKKKEPEEGNGNLMSIESVEGMDNIDNIPPSPITPQFDFDEEIIKAQLKEKAWLPISEGRNIDNTYISNWYKNQSEEVRKIFNDSIRENENGGIDKDPIATRLKALNDSDPDYEYRSVQRGDHVVIERREKNKESEIDNLTPEELSSIISEETDKENEELKENILEDIDSINLDSADKSKERWINIGPETLKKTIDRLKKDYPDINKLTGDELMDFLSDKSDNFTYRYYPGSDTVQRRSKTVQEMRERFKSQGIDLSKLFEEDKLLAEENSKEINSGDISEFDVPSISNPENTVPIEDINDWVTMTGDAVNETIASLEKSPIGDQFFKDYYEGRNVSGMAKLLSKYDPKYDYKMELLSNDNGKVTYVFKRRPKQKLMEVSREESSIGITPELLKSIHEKSLGIRPDNSSVDLSSLDSSGLGADFSRSYEKIKNGEFDKAVSMSEIFTDCTKALIAAQEEMATTMMAASAQVAQNSPTYNITQNSSTPQMVQSLTT